MLCLTFEWVTFSELLMKIRITAYGSLLVTPLHLGTSYYQINVTSSQCVSFLDTSSPRRSPATTANTLFAVRSMAWQFTFGLHGKVIAEGSTERSAFVKQALAACQTGSFQVQARRSLLAWFPVETRLLGSDRDRL